MNQSLNSCYLKFDYTLQMQNIIYTVSSSPLKRQYSTIFNRKLKIDEKLLQNTDNSIFFKELLSHIPSGILIFDLEGKITMANSNAVKFLNLGSNEESVIGQILLDFLKKGKLKRMLEKSIEEGHQDFTIPYITIKKKIFQVTCKKFNDGILLAIQDITINNRIKNEATKSLLLGQEMERQRLSREIHDGIGPIMSTIKLRLDGLKSKTNDEGIKKNLELINSLISDTANEIRSISHALMPGSLSDFGLKAAIDNLVNQLFTPNVEVNVIQNLNNDRFDRELELHVYRIVQELLNNGVKHSNATSFTLKLMKQMDNIELAYQDNGSGFILSDVIEGIGLENVKNRTQILNGTIDIITSLNKGVKIIINIPIHKTK